MSLPVQVELSTLEASLPRLRWWQDPEHPGRASSGLPATPSTGRLLSSGLPDDSNFYKIKTVT